jgi:transcriptional regulator with GAF, ATPase, and Fis domain
VRELAHALERAALLRAPIAIDELGERAAAVDPRPAVDLRVPLRVAKQRATEQLERSYVVALLRETGGNVSQAARRAGVDRMTMHRMIQRLQLRVPERR